MLKRRKTSSIFHSKFPKNYNTFPFFQSFLNRVKNNDYFSFFLVCCLVGFGCGWRCNKIEGMVCLQSWSEQQLYNIRKSICFNGFCNSYFNSCIHFPNAPSIPTKVTQIIKNLSVLFFCLLLLLLDVLFYYSIFSVSLLFYVPLFSFPPSRLSFFYLFFFFAFDCFVFLALGVLLAIFLFRKYFIYKQILLLFLFFNIQGKRKKDK